MADSLTTSFLGALQASLSVLLTIFVGVIASQFSILNQRTTKELSNLCVRIFLPCLLINNLGSNLHPATGIRYLPILVWAICYTTLSMLLGQLATRAFNLPSWVTPALSFNNTTSLPLLLVQSLGSSGILSTLHMSDTDTDANVLERAKSYFLVCAIVSNSLTFSLGPRLLNHEEAPDSDQQEGKKQLPIENSSTPQPGQDEARQIEASNQRNGQANDHNAHAEPNESTSLLPNYLVRRGEEVEQQGYSKGKGIWARLSPRTRSVLDLLYAFLNAPLIGAIIGAIVGLTPPLHRLFFNEPQSGGYFKAWLTSCIQNVGEIFAALQVHLSSLKGTCVLLTGRRLS